MHGENKNYIEDLIKGDVKAFQVIFDLYHPKVYGVCHKMTSNTFYAEEITSQVFVTLWKKREILNPALPILGIIIKITKDLVANYFAKTIKEKSNLDKYLIDSDKNAYSYDESNVIFQLYLDIAENAIQKLPEKRKEIFKLYFHHNHSYTEISQNLGIEESTVRVHVFKALEYLRKHILSDPDFGQI
jgi:RNA polymerase sigma factor (sigma-70 family)